MNHRKNVLFWGMNAMYFGVLGWTFFSPIGRETSPLWTSYTQYGALFLGSVFYGFCFLRSKRTAVSLRFWFMVLGVVVCVPFLWYPMSDDVNRYLWEGYIAAKGHNPYLEAPLAFEKTEYASRSFYPEINHKDKTAIYGGFYLLCMRSLYGLASFLGMEEGYGFLYRFWVCLAVLSLCFLVGRLTCGRQKLIALACLWITNPLWTHFTVAQAHLDVFWIVFLMIAFYVGNQADKTKEGTYKGGWISVL